MEDISRRQFITFLATGTAGMIAGALGIPIEIAATEEVKKQYKVEVGNASVKNAIVNGCKTKNNNTKDFNDCITEYKPTADEIFASVAVAPITEEITFRALPSALVSIKDNDDPLKIVINGKRDGGLGLTRREIIVGVISTMIFGAMHNITGNGFDTKTIPVPQMIVGAINWYLQRKLGIVSSICSHMTSNAIVVVAASNK